MKKILEGIGGARLPKPVGLLKLSLLEGCQEARHRALLGIIAKSEVNTFANQEYQYAKKNVPPEVERWLGRWCIQKSHGLCPF